MDQDKLLVLGVGQDKLVVPAVGNLLVPAGGRVIFKYYLLQAGLVVSTCSEECVSVLLFKLVPTSCQNGLVLLPMGNSRLVLRSLQPLEGCLLSK